MVDYSVLWVKFQVLSGNFDTSSVVSRELIPPIFATQVRVLPHSVHRRTVCLRLELKGCLDRGESNYHFFCFPFFLPHVPYLAR